MAKFEITRPRDEEYRFTLVGNRVKVLLESEIYKNKTDCQKAIGTVRKLCADKTRFQSVRADSGGYFYYLNDENNAPICHSPVFPSEKEMKENIESIIKEAAGAEVEDRTV